MLADWVSVQVDAVQEEPWRTINKPAPTLCLPKILAGIREFTTAYAGWSGGLGSCTGGFPSIPSALQISPMTSSSFLFT